MLVRSEFLNLLRIQPYRWFVLTALCATIAQGMIVLALTWMISTHLHQVSSLALLFVFFWLPNSLTGPLYGVLLDRVDRRTVLVWVSVVRVFLVLAFIGYFFSPAMPLSHLCGFMFLWGACCSAYLPGVSALMRELLPHEKRYHANAGLDVSYEVGFGLGFALAGYLIAVGSIQQCLLVAGFVYLGSWLGFVLMDPKQYIGEKHQPEARLGFVQEFCSAFKQIRLAKGLMSLCWVQVLITVTFQLTPILLAPFVQRVLHEGVQTLSSIEIALSVGIVIGGLLNPYCALRWGVGKVLKIESVLLTASFIAFSFSEYALWAIVWYGIIGFSVSIWCLIVTEAQHRTPMSHQARVQSVVALLSGVCMLLSYLGVMVWGDGLPVQELYYLVIGMCAMAALLLARFKPVDKCS